MKRNFFLTSILFLFGSIQLAFAQQRLDLSNLDAFEVGKNWKIAGDVQSDFNLDENIIASKGEGVLVNIPTEKHRSNLLTKSSYGDIDIELEFMMARHSNSGIYLMGRYEIQLLDSWGKTKPTYGDLGGIYQRRRPDGSQYEGHAPAINASKAPGTWQKMKISFRAPRFDKVGNKVSNAKILEVKVNGFVIQKNIELTGPTGGPISEEEAPRGPLMIQGDHGPVAFRDIIITEYRDSNIDITELNATRYEGDIAPLQSFKWDGLINIPLNTKHIDATELKGDVGWAVVYKGKLNVPSSGTFRLGIQAGGESKIRLSGESVVEKAWSRTNWDIRWGEWKSFESGAYDIEIIYAKVDGWLPTGLGVFIEGKDLRPSPLHAGNNPNSFSNLPSPVFVDALEPRVMRSFIPMEGQGELNVMTHIVNVGSPNGLHYAFDTSSGQLVKIWRGDFLEVTDMWSGRGSGQSYSRGPELMLMQATKPKLNYKSKGYDIQPSGFPIFRYSMDGNEISDEIHEENGKTVHRTIKGSYLRGKTVLLITADKIEKINDTLYSINDKDFFIQSDSPLFIAGEGGQFKLSCTLSGDVLSYTIIW